MTTTTRSWRTATDAGYDCKREFIACMMHLGHKTTEEMRLYIVQLLETWMAYDWKPSRKHHRLLVFTANAAVNCDDEMLRKALIKMGLSTTEAQLVWFLMSHIHSTNKALWRDLNRDVECLKKGIHPTYATANAARVLGVALEVIADMEKYIEW